MQPKGLCLEVPMGGEVKNQQIVALVARVATTFCHRLSFSGPKPKNGKFESEGRQLLELTRVSIL